MAIRFGTLGAANITPRALLAPCHDEPRAAVRCVAARERERAEGFARWHGIPVVHDTYRQVVEDPEIEAVYNPLPIALHRDWTLAALAAGKHVLCEKSFACNAREAEEMAHAAADSGLVLMDAFHYRYHPVFLRAREIVDDGLLGKVHTVEAAFHVPVVDPGDIRNNYETGGGVTMDLGCYPISWARHITGEEPKRVEATAETGQPHVDVRLEARLHFPSGIVATVSGDMREGVARRMDLRVTGEKGTLHVLNPLVPQAGHMIRLETDGRTRFETRDRRPSYGYQLDAFLDAVEEGKSIFTGPDDAVCQMRTIDRCYEAAGLPMRGLDLG